MKKYNCYETDFEGSYTLGEMKDLYNNIVNKSEYETFDIWLDDMLRSGIFVESN